ncbi:MAG: DNA polymerase/3'-5' exonuclease PolX [Pseudomonadota bacterium]
MKLKLDRHQVAEVLEEIATLLDLKGENPFKVRAYSNAARVLEGTDEDLGELIESGKLAELKGIGTSLLEQISTLATTGRLARHEELKSEFPPSLFDLLKIPGLGPKKVKVLYEKLEVKSLGELEYACRENRLLKLEGFGEKTQQKVLDGIAYVRRNQGSFLYGSIIDRGESLLSLIRKLPGVRQASLGGSLRRGREIVRDIDLLCSSSKPAGICKRFLKLQGVQEVLAEGETKASVRLEDGLQVDLRVVSEEEYPFALQYFTGSKDHNTELRALAKAQDFKLNEYGLFKGEKRVACRSEEEIYRKLGLHYIPPELREASGEIDAARNGAFPDLVELKDLRGVLHVHTSFSDGRNSLAEMLQAVSDMGLEYVGIADHSPSAAYAHGLREADLERQKEELDRLQKKYPKLRIFWGTESDIQADGSLDFPDRILKGFDFVVASIHSRFNMPEAEMTKRCLRALENPYCTMIGHPTGRLLLAREGFKVNLHALIDRAAQLGKFMELNAHPQRLDLDWRVLPYARLKGVRISINPDAHDVEGLKDIRFGVNTARKGGLTKNDVLNTLLAAQMEKALEKAKA